MIWDYSLSPIYTIFRIVASRFLFFFLQNCLTNVFVTKTEFRRHSQIAYSHTLGLELYTIVFH